MQGKSLNDLEAGGGFPRRHIGPDAQDVSEMLRILDVGSLEQLIERAVPASIRSDAPLDLPPARNERTALRYLRRMAEANEVLTSMIGQGYHNTHLPPVIQRNVLENPGWYTAYTPYQAEVSQGRLEALLNFQQMIIDLTGMELANASLLDEATAAAEAMAMSMRQNKDGARRVFLVDRDCHPQTRAVVETRAAPLGIEVRPIDPEAEPAFEGAFGLLLQYPGSSGALRDPSDVIKRAKQAGVMVTVAADPLALVLLTPPGEMGADIVVGSAQRFGVPMGYGGPHAAFFATRDAYKRAMPGRIIGVSVDSAGRPALRMALQTREQHIRREKATSNICTAQVLLAVIAALYAVYHGPEGLRRIALRVHRLTAILKAGLERLGVQATHGAFFDGLTLSVPGRAEQLLAQARASGINLRPVDADHVGLSLDETTTGAEVETLWRVFAGRDDHGLSVPAFDEEVAAEELAAVPPALRRRSAILTHPVFSSYRSETEMLRYLRRLAAKDIALDRSMIPLGSCTMKLNATSEMLPITWPEFADLHPFVPLDQARGYQRLFDELEDMLCAATGFDAVSLQPNAGSQGEYSGLLTIRRYHESRGEGGRDLCLIPASAHGTNPASAQMAGFQVVVVRCDDEGNVDVADLEAKLSEHRERVAALMITYPSTHGVFEESIVEICRLVHEAGGQVYMDGANLNALLGVALPGRFGPDVMHMNLHKTFCIPHGGGGPGMGPIGVRAHLAPFLPRHPVVAMDDGGAPGQALGTVSAAPWGSAGILPISWTYIALMGGAGLRRATEVAILNANYVARRLEPHYPVLYRGRDGLVAHECILDLRPIKAACGITVDDVAKRLADYGYHAPTMSFPVPDTLMIEPTESESKAEMDRFCEAMIAIRAEIARVEAGELPRDDNPLVNAPHTAEVLTSEDWSHPYSRQEAAFPLSWVGGDKYWPPVGRLDNVYGDRHLVCTCPPMEAYQTAAE